MPTAATDRIDQLRAALLPARQRLLVHPLYQQMTSLADLQTFMEHHVFAVWDFMSLLKALQRTLTCVDVPWTPRGDKTSRRLINEIVLGEESDQVSTGCTSHFEMYCDAMQQIGANLAPIQAVLGQLDQGTLLPAALQHPAVPVAAAAFVNQTWQVIARGATHEIAAAFTFGREDLIPDLFRALVADLHQRFPGQLTIFHEYLERHIQLDEEEHTPLALRMLTQLCGDDPLRWQAAERVANDCLAARLALWDGVLAAMRPPG